MSPPARRVHEPAAAPADEAGGEAAAGVLRATGALRSRAAVTGLVLAAGLVVAAYLLPTLGGWQVTAHSKDYADAVPPLHSRWDAKLGPGTLPALAIAVLGVWAARGGRPRSRGAGCCCVAYAGSLAWMPRARAGRRRVRA